VSTSRLSRALGCDLEALTLAAVIDLIEEAVRVRKRPFKKAIISYNQRRNPMNQEEQTKKMQKIIAKAWMDDEFKQRLLSEPTEVLQEEGLETPPGVEIRMLENTDNLLYMVLPAKPDGVEVEGVEAREAAMKRCVLCATN
jgi:hypothetical protein